MLNKKIVSIIQARMNSTRLPGKVLKKIGEKSILEILVTRLKTSRMLDDIVVATTRRKADDELVKLSKNLGVKIYRGSEEDVLKRYAEAATLFQASVVVRVTADNPLTDPQLVDEIIKAHLNNKSDYTYCNNVPLGVSVEVVNLSALKKAQVNTKLKSEKEHVTPYIKSNPELFEIHKFDYYLNNNKFRLTVDKEEDLELMNILYEELGLFENLKTENIIAFLEENPEISDINKNVEQVTLDLNSKKVKLSVIIRSHNSENYVRKALKSVLNQTLSPEIYEILVIDDGSTDNTLKILKEYEDNIRLIKADSLGAVKAANLGVEYSKGTFFILLDSDDYFEPIALEEFYKEVIKSSSDFVYSDYFEKYLETREVKLISLKKNIFNSVAGGILFKKSVFKKLGMYNIEIIFPEYEILIKLLKSNYKGIHIPKPLFTYCRHESSLTGNKKWIKKGLKQLTDMYTDLRFDRILKDLESGK